MRDINVQAVSIIDVNFTGANLFSYFFSIGRKHKSRRYSINLPGFDGPKKVVELPAIPLYSRALVMNCDSA